MNHPKAKLCGILPAESDDLGITVGLHNITDEGDVLDQPADDWQLGEHLSEQAREEDDKAGPGHATGTAHVGFEDVNKDLRPLEANHKHKTSEDEDVAEDEKWCVEKKSHTKAQEADADLREEEGHSIEVRTNSQCCVNRWDLCGGVNK